MNHKIKFYNAVEAGKHGITLKLGLVNSKRKPIENGVDVESDEYKIQFFDDCAASLKGDAFLHEVKNVEVAEETHVQKIEMTEEEFKTVLMKIKFFDEALEGDFGEEAQGFAHQALDEEAEEKVIEIDKEEIDPTLSANPHKKECISGSNPIK